MSEGRTFVVYSALRGLVGLRVVAGGRILGVYVAEVEAPNAAEAVRIARLRQHPLPLPASSFGAVPVEEVDGG